MGQEKAWRKEEGQPRAHDPRSSPLYCRQAWLVFPFSSPLCRLVYIFSPIRETHCAPNSHFTLPALSLFFLQPLEPFLSAGMVNGHQDDLKSSGLQP